MEPETIRCKCPDAGEEIIAVLVRDCLERAGNMAKELTPQIAAIIVGIRDAHGLTCATAWTLSLLTVGLTFEMLLQGTTAPEALGIAVRREIDRVVAAGSVPEWSEEDMPEVLHVGNGRPPGRAS